jgi:hypothetical protein
VVVLVHAPCKDNNHNNKTFKKRPIAFPVGVINASLLFRFESSEPARSFRDKEIVTRFWFIFEKKREF